MVRMSGLLNVFVILITADIIASLVQTSNKTNNVKGNGLNNMETRRKSKGKTKHLSTSSESGDRGDKESDDSVMSLDLSASSSSSSSESDRVQNRVPQSSAERKGWRKWHRKCPPCPDDITKKWRDRSIQWICGGYQRARRSFKSDCMMHYRNCQDGTMFVKIHDHRCQNDTGGDLRRGFHFFYEYGHDSQDSNDQSDSDSVIAKSSNEFST